MHRLLPTIAGATCLIAAPMPAIALNPSDGVPVTPDAYLSLPESGHLPSHASSNVRVLGGRVDSPGTSFGCDGLDFESIATSFEQDIEMLGDYVENNAEGLGFQALIYSDPTLYTMFNTTLNDLQGIVEQSLISCQTARQWGNKIGSKALGKCLADGGTSVECNNGENLAKKAADYYNDRVKDIQGFIDDIDLGAGDGRNDQMDGSAESAGERSNGYTDTTTRLPHPAGAGDTGSAGGGDGGGGNGGGGTRSVGPADSTVVHNCDEIDCGAALNGLLVSQYGGMRREAVELMGMTLPGLDPDKSGEAANSDGLITDIRNRKLHKWSRDKREELLARLDQMVMLAVTKELPRSADDEHIEPWQAYAGEPYASPPPRQTLIELANLRANTVGKDVPAYEAPGEDGNGSRNHAIFGTAYGGMLRRIAGEQTRAATQAAINEINAAVLNAAVSGDFEDQFESAPEHYRGAVELLRTEAAQASSYDKELTKQNELFLKINDAIQPR